MKIKRYHVYYLANDTWVRLAGDGLTHAEALRKARLERLFRSGTVKVEAER